MAHGERPCQVLVLVSPFERLLWYMHLSAPLECSPTKVKCGTQEKAIVMITKLQKHDFACVICYSKKNTSDCTALVQGIMTNRCYMD